MKPAEKSSRYMRLIQLASFLYTALHVSRLLLKPSRLSLKAPVHNVKFRNNCSAGSTVYLLKGEQARPVLIPPNPCKKWQAANQEEQN